MICILPVYYWYNYLLNTWASSSAENAIEICKLQGRIILAIEIIRIMMIDDRCFLSSYMPSYVHTVPENIDDYYRGVSLVNKTDENLPKTGVV